MFCISMEHVPMGKKLWSQDYWGQLLLCLNTRCLSEEDEGVFGELGINCFWEKPLCEKIVCEQESQHGQC